MYKVKFISYCGMSDVPMEHDTLEEARQHAAEYIKSRRRLTKVVTLKRGEEWEALEPEDSVMVPDFAGTLVLQHITFECRECGFEHETEDNALQCCTDNDEWFPGTIDEDFNEAID